MKATIFNFLNHIRTSRVIPAEPMVPDKYEAESNFWKGMIQEYMKWYAGETDELYEERPPTEEEKIRARSIKDSAILTWGKIHQEAKYLSDLCLDRSAFKGMRLLDVGSGPHPSAAVFENCELYCLDPLLPKYLEAGFPLHYYGNVHFMHGYSEDIPMMDGFFDAVISVNAIDHVDDFHQTAREIRRVLRPNGRVRMHIHYHPPEKTEPLELNDDIVEKAFGWSGFRKLSESKTKRGYTLTDAKETYALWSNF